MALRLVNHETTDLLNYYAKGSCPIVEDNYSLLGFKNNLPVVAPHYVSSRIKGPIKIIKKLPSSVKLSKLEVDETGEKFINLNGKKLKVVPQNRIPEEVRLRTMVLKQKVVNTAGDLKSPLKFRIIGNTTQLNNADTLQLVKQQSADNKFPTTNQDKPLTGIHGMKKIKLITTKLQKPTSSNQVIHTETSSTSTLSVNPKPIPIVVSDLCENSSGLCPVDSVLPVANRREKLLSKKNIGILNQVKMQALNLSKKKKEYEQLEVKANMPTTEIGVQTDECEKKLVSDQFVQTDIQRNCHENFNLLESIDLDSILEMTGDSPILADVNLGVGPSIGKLIKVDNSFDNICTQTSVSALDNNMGYSVSGKQMNDIRMKKQLMFFKDLRECLVHNAWGNLPIHEGVINNDLPLVKRSCTALTARKFGVNLENHDGCTPLQLAIINDANVDIVQTLLDAGADIKEVDGEGNNILHLGAKFARQKILEVILFHKSFSYCFNCINGFNFEGLTPLMICCISSWTAGAHLFIKHSADVNIKDQTSGRTALFHAAEAQNVEIVRTLLNHKADPKIKNFFGTSPHDAMYELEDMSEMIKSLIFGRSKKRTIEAEMNPVRTAKAAKCLKTFSKLQKIEQKDGVPIPHLRYKMQRQIK